MEFLAAASLASQTAFPLNNRLYEMERKKLLAQQKRTARARRAAQEPAHIEEINSDEEEEDKQYTFDDDNDNDDDDDQHESALGDDDDVTVEDGDDNEDEGEAEEEEDRPFDESSDDEEDSSKPPKQKKPWITRSCLIITLFALIIASALSWLRFSTDDIFLDPASISFLHAPPTTNYYDLLEIPRDAKASTVTASFRKLALKWHPDKNPNCEECSEKFQAIQEAYQVLSDKGKRAIYDSVETSFDAITSSAVDLTPENFDALVTSSPDVWIIQVYSDWHKSAIAFAPIWEEVVQSLEGLIQFGRVHIKHGTLLRRLPVAFRSVPSVVAFVDGVFTSSMLFSHVNSQEGSRPLTKFISAQFPNLVVPVAADIDSVQAFVTRNDLAPYRVVLFTKRTGLFYKAMARLYAPDFIFGLVDIKHLKKEQAFMRDLQNTFKDSVTKFPAVLIYTAKTSLTAKQMNIVNGVTKPQLQSRLKKLLRYIPSLDMTSTFMHRHCQGDVTCLSYVACDANQATSKKVDSFIHWTRKLTDEFGERVGEQQTGIIHAYKHSELSPICSALNSSAPHIVAWLDGISRISAFPVTEFSDSTYKSCREWYQAVIDREAAAKIISAPFITIRPSHDHININIPYTSHQFSAPRTVVLGVATIVALWMGTKLLKPHPKKTKSRTVTRIDESNPAEEDVPDTGLSTGAKFAFAVFALGFVVSFVNWLDPIMKAYEKWQRGEL